MSPHLGKTVHSIADALGANTLNATLILVVAFSIVGLWRRTSAAHRHTIWFASLIAVGLSVLASLWLPKISLPFDASPTVASVAATLGVASRRDPQLAARTGAASVRQAASNAAHVPHAEIGIARPFLTVSGTSPSLRLQTIIVSVWAAGLLILLVRLASGLLLVLQRGRRLRPVDDPTILLELKRVENVLCTRKAIALVFGSADSMPVAYGIRRATIVLPANARHWTSAERRVVLLHEVAHAVRGDIVAQVLADAVCAALWFHPLVWLARRSLRAEAESAADDVVLCDGIPAASYANQLLAFARANTAAPFVEAATVGLFGNSDIERRFTAMLDATRSRSSSSIAVRHAAACLACAIGAMLGTLRFATPAAAAQVATPQVASPRLATIPTQSKPVSIAPLVTDATAQSTTLAEFRIPRVVPATNDAEPPSMPFAVVPKVAPNLSGTWLADTMYIMARNFAVPSRIVVSIEQTPSTIHFVRRGQMPGVVGNAASDSVECQSVVPLDGTDGKATLSYAGTTYDASVSGSWEGNTLVTKTTGVRSGLPWQQIDRWSLESDGSLKLDARASERSAPPDPATKYYEFWVQSASMKLTKVR